MSFNGFLFFLPHPFLGGFDPTRPSTTHSPLPPNCIVEVWLPQLVLNPVPRLAAARPAIRKCSSGCFTPLSAPIPSHPPASSCRPGEPPARGCPCRGRAQHRAAAALVRAKGEHQMEKAFIKPQRRAFTRN